MFSKALFKQSCKANGVMWTAITVALCFMLSCVMLISGNGNVGEVKDSIQDTIIVKEIDSQLKERAISYYVYAEDGLKKFDVLFAENACDTLSYLSWCGQMPNKTDFESEDVYAAAINAWQNAKPELKTEIGKTYSESVEKWQNEMPNAENYTSSEKYLSDIESWQNNSPATQENAVKTAYADACEELQKYANCVSEENGYESDSTQSREVLGCMMYTLNPNGNFDSFYTENGDAVPEDYDVMTIVSHIAEGDVDSYISSDERAEYVSERAENGSAVFLAGNITSEDSVNAMLDALGSYGVTEEKYKSFGYTYSSVKHLAKTAVVTYCGRLDYELSEIAAKKENGEYPLEEKYLKAISDKKAELSNDVSTSFLSTLPAAVSEALEEIGQADLYTLIVGSIFYKLAGLLLPIIYMIMASNNLIVGQVDSGSMAYVLSTSTKRITVVFTQAVYLLGSLLAMFSLTTVTGCICLSIVQADVELTYGNLILLNVGAFLVLAALSGLCFFTSCIFDRSKHSMAIGGGLSIFALVAAMLGLFGSPVIPSVVRLNALNCFNYATVISLFDVVSIIDGTDIYIAKFVILAVLGIIGYILGAISFTKKDLPL